MSIPTPQPTSNTSATTEGDNMPDIQALTLRAEQLGHAVGSWNTWILVTMVAAALAATGLVYVQRRAFQTAKDWADANQALGAAKEAVLRKQVADANERAGNANKEAARANEAAGKANEAAGKAKEAAGKALERAGVLEKEAADERVTAEQLRQQNLATEGRLTAANRVLEEERLRRLELEKSLAPRDLPFILYVDGTTNVDDLKQFPGIE